MVVGDDSSQSQIAAAFVDIAYKLIHPATARHICYKARCECRRGEEVSGQLNVETVATDYGQINTPCVTKNRQGGTTLLDARLAVHSGYGFCCVSSLISKVPPISFTAPYAMKTFKNVPSSAAFIALQHKAIGSFLLGSDVLHIQRGFCLLGAVMEVGAFSAFAQHYSLTELCACYPVMFT